MDDFNEGKTSNFHFAVTDKKCSCGAVYATKDAQVCLLNHIDEITGQLGGQMGLFDDAEIRKSRLERVFNE